MHQEQMIIEGIYRKNTRGRAYLIFQDAQQCRRIVRISGKLDADNGQAVTVVGSLAGGRFVVTKMIPHVVPRRPTGSYQAGRCRGIPRRPAA